MFDSACASCHHDGDGPTLLGVNTPLALNSSLTSARPDNLLRTILDGVREPASRDIGFMPAFREALDDRQIAELAGYMRARFAPQEPAWANLPAEVARVRASTRSAGTAAACTHARRMEARLARSQGSSEGEACAAASSSAMSGVAMASCARTRNVPSCAARRSPPAGGIIACASHSRTSAELLRR